jgi:hypothetical protein
MHCKTCRVFSLVQCSQFIYLFVIYTTGAASDSDNVSWNVRTISKQQIGRDVERKDPYLTIPSGGRYKTQIPRSPMFAILDYSFRNRTKSLHSYQHICNCAQKLRNYAAQGRFYLYIWFRCIYLSLFLSLPLGVQGIRETLFHFSFLISDSL